MLYFIDYQLFASTVQLFLAQYCTVNCTVDEGKIKEWVSALSNRMNRERKP
jgi:hypothetical protein